jgi:hypothetical protein
LKYLLNSREWELKLNKEPMMMGEMKCLKKIRSTAPSLQEREKEGEAPFL